MGNFEELLFLFRKYGILELLKFKLQNMDKISFGVLKQHIIFVYVITSK